MSAKAKKWTVHITASTFFVFVVSPLLAWLLK